MAHSAQGSPANPCSRNPSLPSTVLEDFDSNHKRNRGFRPFRGLQILQATGRPVYKSQLTGSQPPNTRNLASQPANSRSRKRGFAQGEPDNNPLACTSPADPLTGYHCLPSPPKADWREECHSQWTYFEAEFSPRPAQLLGI